MADKNLVFLDAAFFDFEIQILEVLQLLLGGHIREAGELERAQDVVIRTVRRFDQSGKALLGPCWAALDVDCHVSVLLDAGTGGDQTTDDDVLLQTNELVFLSADGGLGEDAGRLLERRG